MVWKLQISLIIMKNDIYITCVWQITLILDVAISRIYFAWSHLSAKCDPQRNSAAFKLLCGSVSILFTCEYRVRGWEGSLEPAQFK